MRNIDIKSINEVIELSRAYRCDYDENGVKETVLSGDLEDIINATKEEKALYNYLMKTEFETIKDIMAIMYLGRDRDYNKNDSPELIYNKQRKWFDEDGWDEKDIVVDRIVSKVPLEEYLIEGLKILKLR